MEDGVFEGLAGIAAVVFFLVIGAWYLSPVFRTRGWELAIGITAVIVGVAGLLAYL